MKANIDERGVLLISPESPLELFALNAWWQDYNLHTAHDSKGSTGIGVVTPSKAVIDEWA